LRQAITEAIAVQGHGVQAFARQIAGQQLQPDQQALANAFYATHPNEALTLNMAGNPATAGGRSSSPPGPNFPPATPLNLTRAAQGPFQILPLADDASAQVLAKGMNPGGFTQDVLWTNPQTRADSWHDLFVWPPPGVAPQSKGPGQLRQEQQTHMLRIQEQS